MEIQQLFFFPFVNPIELKPVIWAVRVAVKPKFGTFNGASASRLVHEALRHQRNLIAEYPRQSDTLDQVLAAFILTAENIKVVLSIAFSDQDEVVRSAVSYGISSGFEHQFQPEQDITPKGTDGLAAHGKVLTVERMHRPHHE